MIEIIVNPNVYFKNFKNFELSKYDYFDDRCRFKKFWFWEVFSIEVAYYGKVL